MQNQQVIRISDNQVAFRERGLTYMEYNEYIELVNKYYKNDCRECNFQNRIIIPFLEAIAKGCEIVDVSTLYRNWKGIGRNIFAGRYTPDIIIVDEWKLCEENRKRPKVIVEVKTPKARDRKHAKKEIEEYLELCDVVILTNCISWEIYDKRLDNKILKYLESMYSQQYKGQQIEYPTDVCLRLENDEYDIKWNKDEKEWNDLISEITRIVKDL